MNRHRSKVERNSIIFVISILIYLFAFCRVTSRFEELPDENETGEVEKPVSLEKDEIHTGNVLKPVSIEKNELMDKFHSWGKNQNRIHTVSRRCCMIWYDDNAAHVLTTAAFQVSRCGPVVVLDNYDEHPTHHHHHFKNILKAMNKKVMTKFDCYLYYEAYPEKHPKDDYAFAYGLMSKQIAAGTDNPKYDALEVGRQLRKVQKAILSQCGLEGPHFAENINNDDEDLVNPLRFGEVSWRAQATSVNIIVRNSTRIMTNYKDLLPICEELKLKCNVIDLEKLWSKPEANDLCYILKQFQNSLVISTQGAETIYPKYLGLRQVLLSDSLDKITDIRHYGTANVAQNETQVNTNLFQVEKEDYGGLDPFYVEFALHFGSELTIVHGKPQTEMSEQKRDEIMKSVHCIMNKDGKEVVPYCLDIEIDLSHVKSILKSFINDGSLTQIVT